MQQILFIIFILTSVILSVSHATEPKRDSWVLFDKQNWQTSGELAVQSRLFQEDKSDKTEENGLAIYSKLNSNFSYADLSYKLTFFSRIDYFDAGRNIIEFEDNFLTYTTQSSMVMLAGYKVYNWSVLEAFHPTDIINSQNFDSDLEDMEKIGELTLSTQWQMENGDFTLFYLPRYQDPHYPQERSRMSLHVSPSPLISDTLGESKWVEKSNVISGNSWGHQGGAKIDYTIFDADISLHAIHHMDRTQPLYALGDDLKIHPYFFRVTQLGGSYQQPLGPWLVKLEAGHRDFKNHSIKTTTTGPTLTPFDHTLTAMGVERGISHENGTETTLLAEIQSIFGTTKAQRAATSAFQRDMMLGARYTLNNVLGCEITASLIFDLERSHEYLYSLKYSQRLSDFWKFKTGIRFIDAPKKAATPQGLEHYDENNHLFFNLTRFF